MIRLAPALGVGLGPLGPLQGPPGPLLGVILASWRSLFRAFLEHFCIKAWRHEKSKKKNMFFIIFGSCFLMTFVSLFFALPATPVQARTLEKQQIAWKVLHFLRVGHFRAEANKYNIL